MGKTMLIKKILFSVFVFFCLLLFAYTARNFFQAERFSDEVGHWVVGHYVLEGKVLYRDLQLNHQPLNYLFGALVEKMTPTTALFSYINYQRAGIFTYSMGWNMIFLLIFGWQMIIFTFLFEISKYFLSGYKTLGGTIAVYPLVLLFGLTAKKIIFGKCLRSIEYILFSAASFLVVFSLIPLIPTVFLLNGIMLIWHRKNVRIILYVILPFCVLFSILFLYIPFADYVRETIIYNVRYYLPTEPGMKSFIDYMKAFCLPFMSLFSLQNSIAIIVCIGTLLYAFITYIFIKQKKSFPWIYILLALVFTNNRITSLKENSFHLLPWYGVFLFLLIYVCTQALHKQARKYGLILVISVLVWFYGWPARHLFVQKDPIIEYQNNYSETIKYATAIQKIKTNSDRLIAYPDDPLINWLTGIPTNSKIFEYYDWIYTIPQYRKELMDLFKNHPPDYLLIMQDIGNPFLKTIIYPSIQKYYSQVFFQGKPSSLYIRKTKIKTIRQTQWKAFETHLFQKP